MRIESAGGKYLLIATLFCISANNAHTHGFEACLDQMQKIVAADLSEQNEVYRQTDGPQARILPENEPIFLRGQANRGAVLLLHGIMSSPQALRTLAEDLQRQGLSVYAPLIYGFGSTVNIENKSTLVKWQNSVDRAYRVISQCFRKISLAGFSLGGGLATDFVLHRYEKKRLEQRGADIHSLILLSPAIRPAEKGGRIKAAFTLPITDAVPFAFIQHFKDDPDIRAMMKHPEKHNQYFPVYVGLGLLDLADALKKSAHQRFNLHPLPVCLDYSQQDTSTNWRWTREFLTDAFFNVKIFSYAKEQNIPHTLRLDEKNPVGEEIRNGVSEFVLWYDMKAHEEASRTSQRSGFAPVD